MPSVSQRPSSNNLSVLSGVRDASVSAFDVYETVYGFEGTPQDLQRIYEPNASYENPLVTATSREMITSIHRVAQVLSTIDMPRPLSLIVRSSPGENPWFRILRIWSEVSDICETESFDGHRKSIVEHTVHFLFLPGLHSGRIGRPLPSSDSSSDIISSHNNHLFSIPHFQRTSDASLALPGTQLSWPSPLHFELRMLSRLEFTRERVLHHRDIWDVKDLVALVPGAKLVQYIGARVSARALAAMSNIGAWFWGWHIGSLSNTASGTVAHSADNCLGLLDIDKPPPHAVVA
ncbi:hypothetical protein M422DRAFT_22663 [Sphaerobolus stellatus SS14]|nr:hypothetical protein M422DRAFT_22663 [Sphaerobolus stellatus SS14]